MAVRITFEFVDCFTELQRVPNRPCESGRESLAFPLANLPSEGRQMMAVYRPGPGRPQDDRWTIACYDGIAREYAARWEDWQPADLPTFCSSLPAGARVADVGCGPGRDLDFLLRSGLSAVGLDLSSTMLDVARDRPALRSRLARSDMRALPLRSASLEGIACIAAFLHIPKRSTANVLDEFRRALSPGGQRLVVTQQGAAEEYRPHEQGGRRFYALYTADELTSLLAGHGFDIGDTRSALDDRRDGIAWITVFAQRR